jgi:hypothetical protein
MNPRDTSRRRRRRRSNVQHVATRDEERIVSIGNASYYWCNFNRLGRRMLSDTSFRSAASGAGAMWFVVGRESKK